MTHTITIKDLDNMHENAMRTIAKVVDAGAQGPITGALIERATVATKAVGSGNESAAEFESHIQSLFALYGFALALAVNGGKAQVVFGDPMTGQSVDVCRGVP